MSTEDQPDDLFEGPSEVHFMRLLLEDLHDDLAGKIGRYRYLADVSAALSEGGTMLFGGSVSYSALSEARSSFVHGNFVATILLCQSLAENTLAGYLHARLEDLPPKISFSDTLKRAQARGVLAAEDAADLKKIAEMRNPLSHFRDASDSGNLLRRSATSKEPVEDLLSKDAHFALATIVRLLANPPFRVS